MSVDYPTTYVAQSTPNTCWAASTAMMLGRSTDTEIVKEMQAAYPNSVWDDGATELELGEVAKAYGLEQVTPMCQDSDGWEQWLNEHGPMLVQVPGNAYHSIVVAGIRGGDDPENQSTEPVEVHVLDPWSGDQWLSFDTFNNNYELAGDWTNNVYKR